MKIVEPEDVSDPEQERVVDPSSGFNMFKMSARDIFTNLLAYIGKACFKALEWVFSRGISVRSELRQDDDGKRYLWTKVNLNATSELQERMNNRARGYYYGG